MSALNVVIYFNVINNKNFKKKKRHEALGLADIKFWKVISRQILIYITPADIAERWMEMVGHVIK